MCFSSAFLLLFSFEIPKKMMGIGRKKRVAIVNDWRDASGLESGNRELRTNNFDFIYSFYCYLYKFEFVFLYFVFQFIILINVEILRQLPLFFSRSQEKIFFILTSIKKSINME